MEPGHYTDPLEDALSHGSQRVAQFGSLIGAMAQVGMQRKALHDAKKAARNDEQATRVLDEQERLMHRQARLSWASAHDPQWLAQADLLQTGRAWAGAASYADTDPAAAAAMRKCEDRLRTLHPYAMARYDRLREDGMSPLDAMRETAPLFGRPPDVRVGEPAAARPAVDVGTGAEAYISVNEARSEQPTSGLGDGNDEAAELRGRQSVERMQASARVARRPELGRDELAMVLEAATNLPDEVIARITRQADSAQGRVSAGRSAAQLAAESFPHSAADAVRAAATAATKRPAPTPARVPAHEIANRPGPSM
jgi:hypothetical protein